MGKLMGLEVPKGYFKDKKKEEKKQPSKPIKKPVDERSKAINDSLRIIRNETEYYIELSLKDKKGYKDVDVVMALDKIAHKIMELKLK